MKAQVQSLLKVLRRPYHPHSIIPVGILLLLAVLLLRNLIWMADLSARPNSAVDFRTVYLGSVLLSEGQDPYEDRLLKEKWREVAQAENIQVDESFLPGWPYVPLVYPPWTLTIFLPFTWLTYSSAVKVYDLMIPLLLLLIAGTCAVFARGKLNGVIVLDLLILVLSLRLTKFGYLVGQPFFLCLTFGFLALAFARRDESVKAGIFLGLSAGKVSLFPPFLLMIIFWRQFRILTWGIITGVCLNLPPLWKLQEPLETYLDYGSVLSRLSAQLSATGEIDYWAKMSTNPNTLFAFILDGTGPSDQVVWLALALVSAVVWFARIRWNHVDAVSAFSLFAVTTLLGSFHMVYDCLLLVPLYFVVRRSGSKMKGWLLLVCSPLFLPVSGLVATYADFGALQLLYFNDQAALLTLWVTLLFQLSRPLRQENRN